jgi:hypothetical protein
MQQGSSTIEPASSTATLTDEQILGIEPEGGAAVSGSGDESSDESILRETTVPATPRDATRQPTARDEARDQSPEAEPAWLKTLDAQPEAAAEARQWREAARDIASLDAGYFTADPAARAGLAARLYESDPAAFRAMLAEGALLLSGRDPRALAELARELGAPTPEARLPAPRTLAHAARTAPPNQAPDNGIARPAQVQPGAFPAEAYREFETATNREFAQRMQEAIGRTLGATLPEGIADGARRRIGEDVFQEVHAALASDRALSRQVGEALRGWRFDDSTQRQVVGLLAGRARAVLPEVARRVVAEWTSSVLAADRTRAARIDAAASRQDITGGHLPEPVPSSALRPRDIDYARVSDEQILDL